MKKGRAPDRLAPDSSKPPTTKKGILLRSVAENEGVPNGDPAKVLTSNAVPDVPNLYEMKVAWALLRICANEPRFVRYLPHQQAEIIAFFRYLDHEATGEDIVRARELLGEVA